MLPYIGSTFQLLQDLAYDGLTTLSFEYETELKEEEILAMP